MAYVNVYKMADDLASFRILSFQGENDRWLDFVSACRRGDTIYQNYDVIIGNFADDDVFKTVDCISEAYGAEKKH